VPGKSFGQKVNLTALLKWTPGGEKISGYKLQSQKIYLAALPKCTTGGEKVSSNKLQCQNVYLTALLKWTRYYLPSLHLLYI
jgi:hypothetical protein